MRTYCVRVSWLMQARDFRACCSIFMHTCVSSARARELEQELASSAAGPCETTRW